MSCFGDGGSQLKSDQKKLESRMVMRMATTTIDNGTTYSVELPDIVETMYYLLEAYVHVFAGIPRQENAPRAYSEVVIAMPRSFRDALYRCTCHRPDVHVHRSREC